MSVSIPLETLLDTLDKVVSISRKAIDGENSRFGPVLRTRVIVLYIDEFKSFPLND